MGDPTIYSYTTLAGSAPSIRELGWPDEPVSHQPGKVSYLETPGSNDVQPEYVALDLPDVRVSFTENDAGEMTTGSLIKIKATGRETALFKKLGMGYEPLNDEATRLKNAWDPDPRSPGLPLPHGIRMQLFGSSTEQGVGLGATFDFPTEQTDAIQLHTLAVHIDANSPAVVTEYFEQRQGEFQLHKNLEMALKSGGPVAPTWKETVIKDLVADLTTTHRLNKEQELITEYGSISEHGPFSAFARDQAAYEATRPGKKSRDTDAELEPFNP